MSGASLACCPSFACLCACSLARPRPPAGAPAGGAGPAPLAAGGAAPAPAAQARRLKVAASYLLFASSTSTGFTLLLLLCTQQAPPLVTPPRHPSRLGFGTTCKSELARTRVKSHFAMTHAPVSSLLVSTALHRQLLLSSSLPMPLYLVIQQHHHG